ncbi:hypothetical protein HJC23_006745 [Cyclotella cryptica]|uniref:TOG domain-containing protein n=1 Tax=Cyclotella cryptica TaxID=29204 RepID=A0ABD3PPN9_9STRA
MNVDWVLRKRSEVLRLEVSLRKQFETKVESLILMRLYPKKIMTSLDLDELPLLFDVVECSSEEEGFECLALQNYHEDGDGWLSERHCTFPQVLVLKIRHQDEAHVIAKLDILCHEFNIPQTIEVSVGYGSIDGHIPSMFQKLGYVSMDCNEHSQHQDRELKTIPIGKPADFIKLLMQEPFQNKYNSHGQVGIVGLRVFGAANHVREATIPEKIGMGSDNGYEQGPALKFALPSPLPSSLPPQVKDELDPKIQQSVTRLETLKKSRAALEDFDTAAKIKEAMGTVYALLIIFKESEIKMREAAAQEEYVEAARFKSERDKIKDTALAALSEVEKKFIGQINDEVNLSMSTIKDESFFSRKSTNSMQPFSDEKKDRTSNRMVSYSKHDDGSTDEENFDARSHPTGCEDEVEDGKYDDDHDDNDDFSNASPSHPLAGVDNAEELPAPEEISKDISLDLVQKNWQLREAALAKMGLLLPQLFDVDSLDICSDMANTLTLVISRSIDDKNVQVYQSALILLDESLLQFERKEMPEAKVTLLLSKIIADLLSKLADSKQKVVDSAELSLLTLAHSTCIDFAYICNAATKKVRTADAKGGRTIKARLQFLENLIADFDERVPWNRVIDFAKASKAFDHKDVAVRDAAKSVVITLMVIHGEDVTLQSLEDCEQVSERQLNEYRAKYAAIMEETRN